MSGIASQKSRRAVLPCALLLWTLFECAACRSSNTNSPDAASQDLVIVNAPAAGEVRRVLVSEGATISDGAVIAEIAARQETPNANAQAQNNDPQAQARSAAQAMQTQITAARAAAERASIEAERMSALVASGAAPQPQLDAARAEYQRAQEQLQRAQSGTLNNTVAPLISQANNANNASGAQSSTTATREQIIAARATVAGTISVIAVRAGQQVTAGQPLATIRTK
ncbi:MAG: hypothetical protein ACR2LC_07995 [Pyrinomonadaceae bacterium]